jgi:hypothetical protein
MDSPCLAQTSPITRHITTHLIHPSTHPSSHRRLLAARAGMSRQERPVGVSDLAAIEGLNIAVQRALHAHA